MPMIDAAIHEAVMALPPDERRDRAKVNEAVRDGLKLGPLRPGRRRGSIRRAEGDGVAAARSNPQNNRLRGGLTPFQPARKVELRSLYITDAEHGFRLDLAD